MLDLAKLNTSTKVLEINSKTTMLARKLSGLCDSVVSIDTDKKLVDTLNKNATKKNITNVKYVCGNLSDINDKYDLVITVNSLHHINDMNELVSNIKKVLTKDGRYIIIDNESSNNEFNSLRDKFLNSLDNTYTKTVTKDEIVSLLKKANLKPTNMNTYNNPIKALDFIKENELNNSIIKVFNDDVYNGIKCGMNPYVKNNEFYFDQSIYLISGINND